MPKLSSALIVSLMVLIISQSALAAGICNRTAQIREALQLVTHKSCASITNKDLAAIKGLDVVQTGITSFKAGDLDGLSSLQTFHASFNNFTTLPEQFFRDTKELWYIGLECGELASLPPAIFSGLSNLKSLELFSNNFSSLPAALISDI